MGHDAARQVPAEVLFHPRGHGPPPEIRLFRVGEERLDMMLDDGIERCGGRAPRTVDRTRGTIFRRDGPPAGGAGSGRSEGGHLRTHGTAALVAIAGSAMRTTPAADGGRTSPDGSVSCKADRRSRRTEGTNISRHAARCLATTGPMVDRRHRREPGVPCEAKQVRTVRAVPLGLYREATRRGRMAWQIRGKGDAKPCEEARRRTGDGGGQKALLQRLASRRERPRELRANCKSSIPGSSPGGASWVSGVFQVPVLPLLHLRPQVLVNEVEVAPQSLAPSNGPSPSPPCHVLLKGRPEPSGYRERSSSRSARPSTVPL